MGNLNLSDSEVTYIVLVSLPNLAEAFLDIVNKKMQAAGSFVVALVDAGLEDSSGWPFVSLTSFERRAATMKELSEALYVGINPIVTDEERERWEYYSTKSRDAEWYEESVKYQQELGIMDLDNRPQVETDDPTLNLTTGVANRIYDLFGMKIPLPTSVVLRSPSICPSGT